MQTMEQSLANLIQHRIVTVEDGLSRSSRPQQLVGILERAGFPVDVRTAEFGGASAADEPSLGSGLRVAGG
jgi:hypothetical protein